ncbi:hypothetical protein QA811_09005 [Streptomyces sp. B21-102]|uniref:hypothetical protein n=1 Tax=unclassified Streptomyces TaxID=2593676 RepID=UPI002FF23D9E
MVASKVQPERSEVDALAAYVKALGGKSRIVADFGDEACVLGRPVDALRPRSMSGPVGRLAP